MAGRRDRSIVGLVTRLALVVAFTTGASAPGDGTREAIGTKLKNAGWTLYADSRWAPARFRLTGDGAIEARTNNSTALIWKKVAKQDSDRPILSWQWRVAEAMAPTDITVKGGDDRPLAIHVWFMEPPERQSIFQTLQANLLEFFVGFPVHGKVLTYVWGGLGKRGDSQHNPHIGEDSWMIVLRPGRAPTRTWFTEERDLVADYKAAFGTPPPPRGIIALAADSEDTGSRSRAVVRDIAFSERGKPTIRTISPPRNKFNTSPRQWPSGVVSPARFD